MKKIQTNQQEQVKTIHKKYLKQATLQIFKVVDSHCLIENFQSIDQHKGCIVEEIATNMGDLLRYYNIHY